MFKPRVSWVVASCFWIFTQSTWIGFVDAKPDIPVIFIYGILGNETEWQAFGDILRLQNGWSFGGCPRFDKTQGKVVAFSSPQCPPYLSSGYFYRMLFSDNQMLTFHE